MDSKIITINTLKGGVGKTTITTNLASQFAIDNPKKKICLVDLDGQCGVSMIFGRTPSKYENFSLLSLITGERNLNEVIFNDFKMESKEDIENLYLIPAENKLFKFDEMLFTNPKLKSNFIATMKFLKENFDFIFIDTHPDISRLNTLAYYCSDLIILPFEPDMQNSFAVLNVMNQTRNLQDCENSKFYLLPNKIKINTRLHQDVLEYLKGVEKSENTRYPNTTYLAQNYIPNTTQYSSVPSRKHIPLTLTKSNSKTLLQHKEIFQNISKEILGILKKG